MERHERSMEMMYSRNNSNYNYNYKYKKYNYNYIVSTYRIKSNRIESRMSDSSLSFQPVRGVPVRIPVRVPVDLHKLHKEASNELSTLKRVSHRLAMTDAGPQLEKVLSLLLPRLLRRIGSNQIKMNDIDHIDIDIDHNSEHTDTDPDPDPDTDHNSDTRIDTRIDMVPSISSLYDNIHATLIEMMSHIIKRVRADSSCKLPCIQLLEIMYSYDPQSQSQYHTAIKIDINPFTLNLSLTFMTIGMPRCPVEELERMLPGLVAVLDKHSSLDGYSDSVVSVAKKNQAFQVAHLVLRAVEGLVVYRSKKRKAKTNDGSESDKKDKDKDKDDGIQEEKEEKEAQYHPMDVLRGMCRHNNSISATLYDLFLDVLLYQSSNTNTQTGTGTNLPPPGLSQIGTDRLVAGNSVTAKNWALEHASGSRLKDLKLALLDFIAPCRRFDPFHVAQRNNGKGNGIGIGIGNGIGNGNGRGESDRSEGGRDENDENDMDCGDENSNSNGDENENENENENCEKAVARAVALMVVAQGDRNLDVAGRAGSYLKAHMDSLRNTTTSRNAGNEGAIARSTHTRSTHTRSTHTRSTHTRSGDNASDAVLGLLGDPIALVCELLGVILGGVITGSAFKKLGSSNTDTSHFHTSLGRDYTRTMTTEADAATVISTKRRMVPQQNATTIMSFLMTRAIDDFPTIFTPPSMRRAVDSMAQYFDCCAERATFVGTLVIMAANKYAGSGHSLSGLSLTSSVGNPSVASVKLLNSVCVRLVALFDAMTTSKDDDHEGCNERWITSVHDILARSFLNGCNIVSMAASSHSGDVQSAIGIEARDAAYGIICTICRSNMVSFDGGIVFHGGEAVSSEEKFLSTKTAKTLFGCVSNEAETLKPRAVAALDSLLAAYCRHLDNIRSSKVDAIVANDQPSNPWAMQVDNSDSAHASIKTQFEGFTKSLLPLLWNALQPTLPKASRHAAAQWASSLLKSLDLNASCHMLCFIAGDKDVTSASLALSGLGLTEQVGRDIITSTSGGQDVSVPDFHDFVDAVFSNEATTTSWRPNFLHFSPKGKGVALRFGLICLLSDFYGGDDTAISKYLDCITKTLQSYEESSLQSSKKSRDWIELLDEASICYASLLKASGFARQSISDERHYLTISQLADLALSVSSSKARRYLASAYLHLLSDASIWNAEKEFEISVWIQKSAIDRIVKVCGELLSDMSSTSFVAAKVHGAAYVGASCVQALRMYFVMEGSAVMLEDTLRNASTMVELLGRGTLHSEEVIGDACAGALAIAFSYKAEDTPVLCENLHESTSTAMKFLNTSLRRFGNGDRTNPQRAASLAEATGIVLAATTVHKKSTTQHSAALETKSDDIGMRRLDCVDSLFFLLGSSANRKDPELALVVGEALAMYADAYSPEGCEWTYPKEEFPADFEQSYANDLPPHAHVLYVILQRELLATSPHKRTAVSPVLLAFVGRAAKKLHQNPTVSKRRDFIKEVCQNLPEIQKAFLLLLADPKSKQIGRESCQLGLAACYAISVVASGKDGSDMKMRVNSDALNESLLRAFGQTSNHGGSALMESRTQHEERIGSAGAAMMETFGAETEVGGASGVSEAALGAFREMASASVVLNRPDILYSLMLLSVSLPTWSSTDYNAVTLLGDTVDAGGNIEEIRLALGPHLKKLIPRLLRACNDPNKQTREQMGALWIGLTGGGTPSRALVTKHLISTIDDLIDDATNKLWRARVGACSALAELIVGRSWQDLGGGGPIGDCNDTSSEPGCASRLLRLYRVTIRSLDDVRLTVREAGETLSRSVRSLTARLCDPSIDIISAGTYTGISKGEILAKMKTSSAASATALPWLVKIGLNQSCAEASGFSVACLLNIVEVARPETLQPVLPDLIGSLLMAMSGLEPAALNYLQERVAGRDSGASSRAADNGYNRLERIRLQMAQSGPLAGALSKCIEMLKNVDVEYQKAVIPELDSALRRGAGFATRAAAADAVSSLCSVSPGAFKFSGNSASNPTVRLLWALYYASERERGTGAKDKMSHALGNLAALAPGSSVRALAVRLCERYNTAVGGTNDDPTARRAVAAALRAIAVRASNQFSDGGTNDIWIKRVLPLAFVAKKDKDVGHFFQEIWDEGGQAARLGINAMCFSAQLQETILPYLTKALIDALEDVSWSRRSISCAALSELSDTNILAPAPRALDNYAVVNEELIARSSIRSQSSAQILTACVKLIVNTRIWTGKADLLKTVTKIASKWVCHSIHVKSDSCPCIPIILSESKYDLFVDDGWFISTDHYKEEELSNMAVDLMDTTGDSAEEDEEQIDFDEGDNLLKVDEIDNDTEMVLNNPEEIRSISLHGLCRLLLDQGIPTNIEALISVDHLSYRSAAIESLTGILESLAGNEFSKQLKVMNGLVAPRILPIMNELKIEGKEIPPLITAKCFRCFSSIIFKDIGNSSSDDAIDLADLTKLFLKNCGPMQSAWTVREGSGLAAAKLVSLGNYASIKKIAIIDDLIECTNSLLKDRKFWKVRLVGLKIILSFCSRANTQSTSRTVGMGSSTLERSSNAKERQLLLEAILPYKERFMGISRSCMTDNEVKVTAAASEIMSAISWWP